MATKMRAVRVPDKVWERAMQIADTNGTNVSVVVNDYLRTLKVVEPVLHKDPPPAVKMKRGRTPVRNLRVSDETWELGQKVAADHGVTITKLIADYLKTLSVDTSKPKPVKTPRRVVPVKATGVRPAPPLRKDPERPPCQHAVVKTLLGHDYCRACGERIR